jgi:hypothetical protein
MPIPFIPTELVSEIVSHLQILDANEDEAEQVEAGKMIALFCRRWRSIGQALRWRTIKLLPLQIPSLVEHFHDFPQLAPFLRMFAVRCPISNTEEEEDEREQKVNAEALAQLPGFLASLNNLRGTIIADILGKHLIPVVTSLSKLPELRYLLLQAEKIEWSSELESIFRNGFIKLSVLTVRSSALVLSTHHQVNPDKVGPELQIRNLGLGLKTTLPSGSTRPDIQFLSILNMSSLITLRLFRAACCPETLEWSLNCPNLDGLLVAFLPRQIRPGFSDYLSVLPHFTALRSTRVELTSADQSSTESPVALSKVLASFPPTLLHLEANSFVFPDYRSLPPGTLPSEDVPTLTALCPSDIEGGEPAQLLVWRVDEEGSHRWYHQVVTEY